MDAFREWALCLIIAAAAGSIVCAVSPRGATDKTVRTVVGIFVVITVCVPLTNIESADSDYIFAASHAVADSGEALNELLLENCKSAVESELKPVAEKYGITILASEMNAYVDEYNCINIHNLHLKITNGNPGIISFFQSEAERISGVPVKISID